MNPVSRTLEHERIANEAKHWVRLTAACNSRCIFCLDSEAQDNRVLDWESVTREIRRGREEKDATRIVLSGGEASIHPRFHDFVRYSREQGYTWIQTVTNGRMFSKKDFFQRAVDAGINEITFSLHGHTAELHDRLTRAPGSFEQIVRAMLRASRSGLIANADIVINKQNVEYIEQIVALCVQVGVREYDLLHVIPQGEAFEHRDQLFYNPADYIESLRKVFRLARNPRFHVWTNRFPVAYLEGLEELIQDPHKMLDEVGGRRMQFRKYLDTGAPIECRHPDRCPHCFIEPFCTSLDQRIVSQEKMDFDCWWVGAHHGLAAYNPGLPLIGVQELPDAYQTQQPGLAPLYLDSEKAFPPWLPKGSVLIAHHPDQFQAPPNGCILEIWLTPKTSSYLLENPEILTRNDVRMHIPTWPTMEQSHIHSLDYRAFFTSLLTKIPAPQVSGLPPCLCPNTHVIPAVRKLAAETFHQNGETAIDALVDTYIQDEYRARSLRCQSCALQSRCPGAPLQYLRHAGFAVLQPISGPWAEHTLAGLPPLPPRLSMGSSPQPPAPRVPVPPNPPLPEIDIVPGRRS